MDKRQAEEKALRLWRELPVKFRSTHAQATEFARQIAPDLPFDTLGTHDVIVEAWLHRELQRTQREANNRTAEAPSRFRRFLRFEGPGT